MEEPRVQEGELFENPEKESCKGERYESRGLTYFDNHNNLKMKRLRVMNMFRTKEDRHYNSDTNLTIK